ncbi:MAG: dTDP-4-dehydrorhamnose reductase [Pseudomonadota bacterium]
MRTMLVTGGDGQLGRALGALVPPAGWRVKAAGRGALDVADAGAVAKAIGSGGYAAVINAAAYTDVDRAKRDAVEAWRMNALAPAGLAAACAAHGVPIVHISTDYVFDGRKPAPYEPGDRPAPCNIYGASKLGGEIAVAASGARHVILRTAWLISPYGHNFATTMMRLAAERRSVRVVADQIGNPTLAGDLAQAAVAIAIRLADDPTAPSSIYHFANAGAASWAELARALFAQSCARGGPSAAVEPIGSADWPTPARRPANSRLSTQSLTDGFGITPRPWRDGLPALLDMLIGDPR